MLETITAMFTDVRAAVERPAVADPRARVQARVQAGNGEIVKDLGTGLMVVYHSAIDAVRDAVAVREMVSAPDAAVAVGMSAGDAAHEDDDWFGVPVVEAARLCAAAQGGQVLVSQLVRDLAAGAADAAFIPVGSLDLKGLPAPLATYEVVGAVR